MGQRACQISLVTREGSWDHVNKQILDIDLSVYNSQESLNHTSKLSDNPISLPCSGWPYPIIL